jgi:hypothetical protein
MAREAEPPRLQPANEGKVAAPVLPVEEKVAVTRVGECDEGHKDVSIVHVSEVKARTRRTLDLQTDVLLAELRPGRVLRAIQRPLPRGASRSLLVQLPRALLGLLARGLQDAAVVAGEADRVHQGPLGFAIAARLPEEIAACGLQLREKARVQQIALG